MVAQITAYPAYISLVVETCSEASITLINQVLENQMCLDKGLPTRPIDTQDIFYQQRLTAWEYQITSLSRFWGVQQIDEFTHYTIGRYSPKDSQLFALKLASKLTVNNRPFKLDLPYSDYSW